MRESDPVGSKGKEREEEEGEGASGEEDADDPSALFKLVCEAAKSFVSGFSEMVCVTVDFNRDGNLVHVGRAAEEATLEDAEQEQKREEEEEEEGEVEREKEREEANGESMRGSVSSSKDAKKEDICVW